jgi:hypothetical protein
MRRGARYDARTRLLLSRAMAAASAQGGAFRREIQEEER